MSNKKLKIIKTFLYGLTAPLIIVAALILFVIVYNEQNEILFLLYFILIPFVFPIITKLIFTNVDFNSLLLGFLEVPENPVGLKYSVLKDYMGSISTIAFSFSVLMYGNKEFGFVDHTILIIAFGLIIFFLLMYSALCLLEFLYKAVGKDKFFKTIIFGVPASSLSGNLFVT